MTKSELTDVLAAGQEGLDYKDVNDTVHKIVERMSAALGAGERIEIRGFGKLFAALPPTADRAQPQDRRPRGPGRKACPALQAGQGSA